MPDELENNGQPPAPPEAVGPILEHTLLHHAQTADKGHAIAEAHLLTTHKGVEATKALEPVLEASLLTQDKIRDEVKTGSEKIVEAINATPSANLDDGHEIRIKGVKGDKGDKGDTPEPPSDERLRALIAPLIPAPEKGDKGDDGLTPTVEELVGLIRPLIPAPIPGHTPTDDELRALITPLIPAPKQGLPGKKGDKGDAGSADTGEDIVKKLLALEGDNRLPADALRGLPLFGRGGAGYLRELSDVDISGLQAGQGLVWNGKTWVPGSSSGGGAVDSVNGQIGVVVLTTDDIADTVTNPYYADSLVAAYLAANGYINSAEMSIVVDGTAVKLVNDSSTPGNSLYYGTDASGVKGYHSIPTGGAINWGDIAGTLSAQTDLAAALAGKQASLGFTPENVANKDTDGTLAANSDTKYPSQKAVKTYVDTGLATKQASLGFTPENVANKDTDGTLAANSDTKYASQKATKTYADTKVPKNAPITGATHTKITYDANGLVTAAVDATTADIAENTNLYYTDVRVRANRLDQLATPNTDVAWGSHKITGLLDPTAAQDAATKAYVDSVAQGLSAKASVRLATAAALPTNTYLAGVITITATGVLTVDGSAVALNDRILVKDEASQLKNGVYVCTTAGAIGVAAVLTRSTDMDAANEFPGAFVFVEIGTVNAAAGFVCTNSTPPTVGTTAITFTQFSGAGEITAGNGLSKTGNTLAIDTSITVDKTTAQTLSSKTLTAPVINSPTGIVKGDVGLGNVDNTSDATKNAAAVALTNKDLTGAGNTFPTFNQNTTGSAAKLTTARTIDGVSFDGSANITVIAPATHAATTKATPVDADELPLADSAASFVLKKLTWANLKATLKTYFDTIYTFALLSPLTTKGDLLGFSTVNARLGVGSDTQVLTADSTQATGLKWAAPAGGATSGEIKMWPTGTAPTGYLLCDGSAVSRSTYATLFALISTTYGVGDGSTTFNVPNMQGRVPVGKNSGTFPTLGGTGGEETHLLTIAEMPTHSHVTPGQGSVNTSNPSLGYASNNNTFTRSTNTEGGGGSHNNLQPYLVLNYIIKT